VIFLSSWKIVMIFLWVITLVQNIWNNVRLYWQSRSGSDENKGTCCTTWSVGLCQGTNPVMILLEEVLWGGKETWWNLTHGGFQEQLLVWIILAKKASIHQLWFGRYAQRMIKCLIALRTYELSIWTVQNTVGPVTWIYQHGCQSPSPLSLY